MAYWLFQGNPKYYRIQDAIRDAEEMYWLATRYKEQIKPDDEVLMWSAGKDAGIYALATVVEAPRILEREPASSYWEAVPDNLEAKPRCKIRFTRKLLQQPLRRADLKNDPVLKDLLVIRAPQATNFKISQQEWQRVQELIR